MSRSPVHAATVVFAFLLALPVPADSLPDADPRYINDSKIQDLFVKELSRLLEDKKTGDPAALQEQLKAESTCAIELPAATPDPALSPTAIYQQADDSVLCLGNIYKCDKCSNWHASLAGGVVLAAHGIAVTNYHVMANEKASAFGAITRDGRVFPITGVLAASKAADAAIVQLDATGLAPAVLSVNDPVGTPVWAITHPAGRFYTLTTGVISRYHVPPATHGDRTKRVSITADFAKGSSGGGIFNQRGELCAIVTATKSIYYSKEEGRDKNLQMVIKDCVPAESIRALIQAPAQ